MSIFAGNWATDNLIASILPQQPQGPFNWAREAFTTALWNSILSHYFPLHGTDGYVLYHEDFYQVQNPLAPAELWTGWSDMSLAQHYQTQVDNQWQVQAATILIIECKRRENGVQDFNNLFRDALEQLTKGLHETITNENWYHNQPLHGAIAIGRSVFFIEATPNPQGGPVNLAYLDVNANSNLQNQQGRTDAARLLNQIRARYLDWWKNLQNARFGR